MLPPPGLAPTLTSILENASSTTTAIALASSLLDLALSSSPTPTFTSTIPTLLSPAMLSPTPTPTSSSPPENGECRLLGPFAILVQGSLGFLALTALVFKRWRERPQRPLKVWFFDVSKQVVGGVLVHMANLLMSLLSSGQLSVTAGPEIVSRSTGAGEGMLGRAVGIVGRGMGLMARGGESGLGIGGDIIGRMVDEEGKYRPNPCSFYLLNLGIDTTIGIPILILLLRILTALFTLTPLGSPPDSLRSGNYGTPPRALWWCKQSLIYFLGLMGMKICVLIIFLVAPWISRVGDWALRWTEGDEVLQVAFVMLVFPVIMNATQYYIIDSFIKNQTEVEYDVVVDAESGDSGEDTDGEEEGEEGSEDAELLSKSVVPVETVKSKRFGKGSGSGHQNPLKTGHRDYDPLFDGETSPTVVGSASSMGKKADDSDDERKLASR